MRKYRQALGSALSILGLYMGGIGNKRSSCPLGGHVKTIAVSKHSQQQPGHRIEEQGSNSNGLMDASTSPHNRAFKLYHNLHVLDDLISLSL